MTRRLLLIAAVLALVGAAAAFVVLRRPQVAAAVVATSGHDGHRAAQGEDGTPRSDVTLDTRRQQLIGVRTVRVEHSAMAPEIRAAGTVTYDETRQAEINTRIDGWIRELYADYTGRAVKRGEPMFTLYSPDLIAEQNEYLLALRGRADTHGDTFSEYSDRLADAARQRLLRLDMSEADIDQLTRTGRAADTVVFRSPASGVIVEKAAVRGMRVMAGQMLYRVADISSVWVEAEVYETDLPMVKTGARATVSLQGYPGRTFAARVNYIYPSITAETHTVRIRVALANSDGLLKPGMLATVTLHTPETRTLIIPSDALVDTGTQKLVFMAEGDGRFSPREIRVGRRTGADVEVLSGLEQGDVIAASATFFLDSESQLRGALKNYEPLSHGVSPNGTAPALDVTFRSEPESPHLGDTTFVVNMRDASGQPVTNADVTVMLFMPPMPSMNMPAMRSSTTLVDAGGGVYRGTGQILMTGRWDVTVNISRDGRSLGARQFAVVAQ